MPKPVKADVVLFADVFNAQLGVFWTAKKLDAWLKERGIERQCEMGANAYALCVTDSKGVEWFVAWIPRKATPILIGHECLHLAWFVLRNKGVEVTADNHEALAYLQQHLVEQVLEHR